jgi:hypothetical protein
MTKFIKLNSVYKICYPICWSVFSVLVFFGLVSVFLGLVFSQSYFCPSLMHTTHRVNLNPGPSTAYNWPLYFELANKISEVFTIAHFCLSFFCGVLSINFVTSSWVFVFRYYVMVKFQRYLIFQAFFPLVVCLSRSIASVHGPVQFEPWT